MDSELHHIVILLHGIRDNAAWQRTVAKALERSGLEPVPIRYDEYFNGLWFWIPFLTKRKPVVSAETKIRWAISEAIDVYGFDNVKVSIIAHSFGTYIAGKILKKGTDIRLANLVLCGSVLGLDYPWQTVKPRIKGLVVNECGLRDKWPVI